ncbi:MAG: CotH kinase family protein [Verrucomicrobia bacterium]|nr:CotH kinase family protein [Verrucomicrobiota bacterium]
MSSPAPRLTLSPLAFGLILAGALLLVVAVFWRDLIRSARPPELWISEIMAVNRTTLADADGEYPGWIELYNPQSTPVNLEGWALTDNFRELAKWTFPRGELGPHQFLVVFASGKNRTNQWDDLHTNFRLSPKGEYLALVKPDRRTVVAEFLPKYPALAPDLTFGFRVGQFHTNTPPKSELQRQAYFIEPTPGRINGRELAGRVSDTKLSRHRGFYSSPQTVALSTATPGAEIWFTTDGSAPRPGHGTRYERALTVDRTTVLRAAAFKPDFLPTDIDTHTFLFPDQVLRQTGTHFPATWGERNGAPVVADYAMDSEIAESSRYRERLQTSLRSLPTLSLVVAPDDLFHPTNGIYSNPLEAGVLWERVASLEVMYPETSSPTRRAVQVDCGVRVQGGWSRRPEESPKHSFRLEFKERYGASSWNHRLLGSEGPPQFDSLILRAGCNNSWLHWSSRERRQGDLLRDQFMRDSYRATGQLSARGSFFHLYLNGLYWGIYNACERPDEAFQAIHEGGNPADYESRNAGKVLSGTADVWNQLFALANAGLQDPARFEQFRQNLDLEGFSDFMLVQIYGGTSDWDAASNWYAGRRRQPPGRYRFFIWDSERSLEALDTSILTVDDDQSPTRLFQALRSVPAFQTVFRAEARRLLGPGGALSPEATRARYQQLADTLRPAIVAESARWGDYRRDVHSYKEGPYELYTVDDHWEPEVDRLLNRYFPARTAEVIRQLEAAGLY